MPTLSVRSRIAVLFTLCLAVSWVGFAAGSAPGAGKFISSGAAGDALRLAGERPLRIIVELASGDEPLATLAGEQLHTESARHSKRAAIDRLQQRILQRLSHPLAVTRFKHISYLALTVDAAQLTQLTAMSEVVTIREDELAAPTLDLSVPRIGATDAWASGYTGSGQAVAILDTGVATSHPSLLGKAVAEACFSTGTGGAISLCPAGANPSGADRQFGAGAARPCSGISTCAHGTHVAGIAVGNNSLYRGVAPDAALIPVQVFSRFNDFSVCGGSTPCVLSYSSDQLRALDWIYDQRATLNIASVNLSLGGGSYTSASACDDANPAMAAAVSNLRAVGIATAISSGNDGLSNGISAPACVSPAISVGASTASDGVAGFSNSASWLSLLAPGTQIMSSVPASGYASWNGTSMAAPHVAGAVAVLRSAKPTATVNQLLVALTSTGVSITDSRNGVRVPRIQVDTAAYALVYGPGGPPGGADITLVPDTTDSGKYGHNYGSNQHRDELSAQFSKPGGELTLTVTGYDIDNNSEVSVHLNGTRLGYLSKGPNNQLNGGDTFVITAAAQVSGDNELIFRQSTSGWKWGVTNLRLSTTTSTSGPPVVPLLENVLDPGKYGQNYGTNEHRDELSASFSGSSSNLVLSVSGFDIDRGNEVAVDLNGSPLGYLSTGPNNRLNNGDTFNIPASIQISGENRIRFEQQNSGWKWGVTNLLLGSATTAGDVVLVPNTLETGEYGNGYGTSNHLTEFVAAFANTGADMILDVTGYDIDDNTEVSVILNGEPIGYLSRGANNRLNAGDSFDIPLALQIPGENRLLFRQKNAGWVWGVTNLLLR